MKKKNKTGQSGVYLHVRLVFGPEPNSKNSMLRQWDPKIFELAHLPFVGKYLDNSFKSHECLHTK